MTLSRQASLAAGPRLSPKARRRQWWLRIHRWFGIALLVPLALLGLTGSALVWPSETMELVYPERRVAASADPAALTAGNIRAGREALADYGPLAAIRFEGPGSPLLLGAAPHAPPYWGLGPPTRISAYVDPETGEVLDVAASTGDFMWFMHAIHGHLLLQGTGRAVVGWMGVLMLISAISGIVIWWPGKRRVLRSLKWQKREGKMLNLHRQSGVVFSLVLIVEAATGVWISFPAFFAAIVEPGAEEVGGRHGSRPGGPAGGPVAVEDAAWVAALARAEEAYSGQPVTMEAPTARDGSWSVTIEGSEGTLPVTVSLPEGQATVQRETAEPGPAAETAQVMDDVHAAHVGGPVWQWLTFLSGIVLAFLSFTGIYIWAKRKIAARSRRLRKA